MRNFALEIKTKDMNTSYFIIGISSKRWNSSMIVRANGRAYSLLSFWKDFGTKGLQRLLHYTSHSLADNIRVRINGISVYVHFK